MKKLLYVLCGVVVFCSSCNRMNVCEETKLCVMRFFTAFIMTYTNY